MLLGWRPLGWLEAIATRVEAIAIGWRPSLLGWRPSLLGWRPSLLGLRPLRASLLLLLRFGIFDFFVFSIGVEVWLFEGFATASKVVHASRCVGSRPTVIHHQVQLYLGQSHLSR